MQPFYKLKERLNFPLIRAHLCTLALAVSLNATWRVPRDAFRYGGLTYGLILTAALITVALPVTLLQLAVGQLSQQDPVGVWRAVPFFKGIGYLRILISFLTSAYSYIYVSVSIAYFLNSASNSIPFSDCLEWPAVKDDFVKPMNGSGCLSNTFMSAVKAGPEYFIAIALISIVLWIASSFVFYNPVKIMRRIFYALGPAIILLGILTVSRIGDGQNLSTFVYKNDWDYYSKPRIWHSAVVQALWSSQIAGGFLISAGDSVYSNTSVQWTSLAIVSANIMSNWFWLMFWFAVSGTGDKDTSVFAVLVQTYQVTIEEDFSITWTLLIFTIIILSGIIGLLAFLYPIYDRLRRIGGIKWRLTAFFTSLGGAGTTLAIIAGGLPALTLLEDTAVPVLICVALVLEIIAFGFIYGWKTLIEDVEFLIGTELPKYWVWGWWLSPAVVALLTSWWMSEIFRHSDWSDPSWEAITVLSTIVAGLFVLILSACIAVSRQVQYDIVAKIRSSFQPSRHWGPRDPITHYYWLASRDGVEHGNLPRTRYNRRELGQLSRRPSYLTVSESIHSKDIQISADDRQRSNSDDWVYTLGRKQVLADLYRYVDEKKRSKSLDWEVIIKMKSSDIIELNKDNIVFSAGKYRNDNVV